MSSHRRPQLGAGKVPKRIQGTHVRHQRSAPPDPGQQPRGAQDRDQVLSRPEPLNPSHQKDPAERGHRHRKAGGGHGRETAGGTAGDQDAPGIGVCRTPRATKDTTDAARGRKRWTEQPAMSSSAAAAACGQESREQSQAFRKDLGHRLSTRKERSVLPGGDTSVLGAEGRSGNSALLSRPSLVLMMSPSEVAEKP